MFKSFTVEKSLSLEGTGETGMQVERGEDVGQIGERDDKKRGIVNSESLCHT